MTATPSSKGVEPPPSGAKLVIERDEDFSLVLEALELLYAGPSYTETMLAVTGKQALETIRTRLVEAQKRAEVAEAALAERAKNDEQIYRNAQSILAKIHGQKSEVKLEPEKAG